MTAPVFGGAGLFFLHLALTFAARVAADPWNGVLTGTAYLLPLFLFLVCSRGNRPALLSVPTRAGWRRVLPLLPLFLLCVLTAADITAALTGQGTGGGAPGDEPFVYAVLAHALLPALLEEGLFRIALLSPFMHAAPRAAVPLTALLFALAHPAVGQMPYAFLGGLFLGYAAVLGGSGACAIAFHFANNLLSLCLQRFSPPPAAVYAVLGAVCVPAAAVLVARMVRKRHPCVAKGENHEGI